MKKRLIPTEEYPKLLWYQEKRIPCTEDERKILFSRYCSILYTVLKKEYPNSSDEKIEELVEVVALRKVDAECEKPTVLKKIVVETYVEHKEAKEMIESSSTFMNWYKMGIDYARTR